MKNIFLQILGLFIMSSTYAQIVDIPDPNFKNALVNTPCVIFGPPGDCGDVNATIDLNNDGEVQFAEAEIVDFLCIGFQNISSLEGIEAFINLEELYVYNNDLTTIDVSNNLLLHTLDCDANDLISINISQNSALEVLKVQYNQLSELDISGNSSLKSLLCRTNQLSSIDISNNPQLNFLSIGNNDLTTIDLSQHTNFSGLTIENNDLTSIDISQNPMLKSLNIGNNNLSNIDVSNNPLLEFLYVDDNNLSSINVLQNPLLERLYIGGNNLSSLDVSNNTLLEYFSFSNSPLINDYIDLSQHSVLWSLKCENTSISGLNLKNGTPTLPNQLEAYNNPNLFCIDVDDPENIGNDWERDPQVILSEDCQLGLQGFDSTKIVLTPNPVKDKLWVYNDNEVNIISIKIYNTLGNLLIEQNNSSNQIDVSKLSSGIFFAKIKTNMGSVCKKILKK